MMLLDDFLPTYRFSEFHHTIVSAPREKVYDAARGMDMRRSPLVSILLRLRELPHRLISVDFDTKGLGYTLDDMIEAGFIMLADEPPREMVFGLVGRFWTLNFDIQDLTPGEFKSFDKQGYAKVAANLAVYKIEPGRSLVTTETRINCLGQHARNSFRRYWTMIRPFSGLIRREWLRIIKLSAEGM